MQQYPAARQMSSCNFIPEMQSGRESRAVSLDGQHVGCLIRKQRRVCRADLSFLEASVMF